MSKLLALALVLLISVGTLAGSTIAWFTDEVTSKGNKIQSGTLDVVLSAKDKAADDYAEVKDGSAPIYDYDKWEPGYTDLKYFKIVNNGSLAFKFRLNIVPDQEIKAGDLAEVIEVYAGTDDAPASAADLHNLKNDKTPVISSLAVDPDGVAYGVLLPKAGKGSEDVTVPAGVTYPEGEIEMWVALHMKEEAGNEYQNKSVGEGFAVELLATQFTYENDSFDHKYDEEAEYESALPDKWDGTADTSWYNDTDSEFMIMTAEQLAGFAKLVDEGNTFEDKTVKVGKNIDLYHMAEGKTDPTCFNPIGSYRNDKAFMGTFDGQRHTISNVSQNTWALDTGYYYGDLGLGLFGAVEDATIKNLVMDNASISGESAICGTVAATAYGDCIFDNITVKNSEVNDYLYYAGGLVGWASGNHQYKNCNVDESTTVGSQWGDFGNANGGLIGGIGSSGKYDFEDCTVACRIDATNDVVSAYQWYNYRNSGMLIGKVPQTIKNEVTKVATPTNVTCKNVTVIYGDWANYTYCEFAGTGYPYVRVQEGVSVDAYSNVRYGHPTDANGNTVVDDNHVHNEGEAHHKLVEFDQLFGGPADHRYCYYGINSFDGVTVVYNNK